MTTGNSDGSITIDTELDREGFEKGADKLLTAVNDLTQAVNTLGRDMTKSFQQVLPVLQSVADATAGMAEQMSGAATQTAEVNGRITDAEQQVTEATQSTTAAMNQQNTAILSSRTSVSALEREVNSLSGQLKSVSQSAERGFANGRAVLAFDDKLTALEQRLDSARERLADFGNTNTPTAEFAKLTKEVERAEQALFRLYDRRDALQSLGVSENSRQWQRLALDIQNAEDALARHERERDSLAANGGAFISGSETAEFARMQESLDSAQAALERNKAVIDQETLSQARLNVLTAQEAVAAADTAAKREAALRRLQTAQTQLNKAAAAMSANKNAKIPAPDEKKITLWQRLGGAIKSAVSQALKAPAALAKIPFQAMAKGVKALGNGLKSFISRAKSAKLQSNALVKTLTSLKRLLITRIKRMFISSIFNSAKESLQTLALFSDAFNTAMSNIKNSSAELSANLAVSIGTMVEKIEPVLTQLIKAFSDVITYVNAFFAMMSGQSTMTVAKKRTDSYRDSLDGAAKSAEELKNQVYGFDELNKRSDTSENGSGKGSDVFEEVPIDRMFPEELADLKSFLEELKSLWENSKLFDFGEKLGAGLNSLITTLDNWINGTFRPKGVELANTVATLLNGLVSGVNWRSLGDMVADGINSVFAILNTFLTAFNFTELGRGIADAFNGLFAGIDWTLIGETLANSWNALVDTIFGLVDQIEWAAMGDKLAEGFTSFVDTIHWDTMAATITTAVNGIVEAFDHLFNGVDWASVGQKIGKFLSDSLTGINWAATFQVVIDGVNSLFELIIGALEGFEWSKVGSVLAQGINGIDIKALLENAGKIINGVVSGALDYLIAIVEDTDWRDLTHKLWEGLMAAVEAIDYESIARKTMERYGSAFGAAGAFVVQLGTEIWGALESAWDSTKEYFESYFDAYGGDIIAGLCAGILDALINIGTWIYDNIFQPFIDGFKKAFGISSPSKVMEEQGNFLIDGLLNGITNTWKSITEFFEKAVTELKNTLSKTWKLIKQTATQAWDGIKSDVSAKFTSLKTGITTTAEAIKSTLSRKWDDVKQTASTKWTSLKSTITSLWDGLKNTLMRTDWTSVGSNIVNGIKSGVTSMWNSLTSTVSSLASGIVSTVKNLFEIRSPSKVFAEIGRFLDLGLMEGIEDNERAVLTSVSDMAQDVTDQFDAGEATLRIGAEGEGLVSRLTGITARLSDIAGIFHDINAMLSNMGGLLVPNIAAGTEVPYKTRVGSDTPAPTNATSGLLDERLADFAYLLRQILDLLERKKDMDSDELASAFAFALSRMQRGYGGV